MLIEYRAGADGIRSGTANLGDYDESVAWIDAVRPEDDELERLGRLVGFDLPNRRDMTEIELSSRLYREGDAYVMIANLLPKADVEVLSPRPVAFILRKNLLITLRFNDFFSFKRVREELLRNVVTCRPQSIFCNLLEEAKVDRADELELAIRRMEELTTRLFSTATEKSKRTTLETGELELEAALVYIGSMGERVADIRESIASMQRALSFSQTYVPREWMTGETAIIQSLISDLTALSDEASFFMNKLSFNLDATLGMINIEEMKIIRVLSIVTLVLSPPVLIAGIYGMNFSNMPELSWPFGYAFALLLMLGTSVAPILYLKRKKWL